jgi:3-dehydroquinate synthase
MDNSNIYLGGFMAAGKSTVGKLLAEQTKRPFIDTDTLIENREKMPVSRIFSTKGEEYFRNLEKKVVLETGELKNTVIALGGGVLVDPSLRKFVKSSGKVVILSVSAESVLERAKSEEGKRPLLDRDNLENLLEKRAHSYSEGDLVIETDKLSVDEEVKMIVEKFQLDVPSAGEYVTLEGRAGGKEYPVFIGSGLLGRLKQMLPLGCTDPFVISDEMAGPLYSGKTVPNSGILELPRGEEAKSLLSLEKIYSVLQKAGIDRYGSILTLGGGTVGDAGGFAAATWMRGIDLVNCPTTVLAQVDSAIGGKNGINLPGGKNLAGTFYQPSCVICDVDCLLTLSDTEYRQGLAEVVKYGLGHDKRFFSWLSVNSGPIMERQLDVLKEMVQWCIRIKLDIVEKDERESNGERARLNLGHTVAHGIEAASGYCTWKHGDAVSVGMIVVSYVALRKNEMSLQQFEDLYGLLRKFGLQARSDMPWEEILPYIGMDKKFQRKSPRIVLPGGIGNSSLVSDVDLKTIEKAYREVMTYGEKTGVSGC